MTIQIEDLPKEAGYILKRIRISENESTRKEIGKRLHDLEGSLTTIKLAIEEIKNGYRFDDAKAVAKTAYLEKAFLSLESDCQLLKDLLRI
jgi:hypothetical protein